MAPKLTNKLQMIMAVTRKQSWSTNVQYSHQRSNKTAMGNPPVMLILGFPVVLQ